MEPERVFTIADSKQQKSNKNIKSILFIDEKYVEKNIYRFIDVMLCIGKIIFLKLDFVFIFL